MCSASSFHLWFLFVLAQCLGLAILLLTGFWMTKLNGGYNWYTDQVLNYHVLLSVIGMLFLYAESILFYRIFRRSNLMFVNIAHAVVHAVAFIFTLVGLGAIIKLKDNHKKYHFLTSHGWTGLLCIILFFLQWVAGFVIYLFPTLSENKQRYFRSLHAFFGLFIFYLSVMVTLSGINYTGHGDPKTHLYSNFLSLLVVFFTMVVSYIVTKYSFLRNHDIDENHGAVEMMHR